MNYLDTASALHARGTDISMADYVFAMMVTLGEDMETAYAIAYEPSEFKKNMGENEGRYLLSKKNDAESLMEQQNIRMLTDILGEAYRADIQEKALNLTDVKFSGEQTVQILNNLLKTRVSDMDTASVKDVVQILKALTEQGALDVGDGGFSKHFVQIFPKFSALCTKCGHEFDAQRGLGAVCPHCRQEYRWSEEENRFYPAVEHL
jgi:hypothetical protein